MEPKQLRDIIIIPLLTRLSLCSPSAVTLLLGTCAAESGLGEHLIQEKGPALGIYQIEPLTHRDLYTNYLSYNSRLREALLSACYYSAKPADDALIHNLFYATGIARLIYARQNEPLPEASDLEGMGQYWKTHYNTAGGAGDVSRFVAVYRTIVVPGLQ